MSQSRHHGATSTSTAQQISQWSKVNAERRGDLLEELVWERVGRFDEVYETIRTLGEGAMGTVTVVRKRRGQENGNDEMRHLYAAKILSLKETTLRLPRPASKARLAELRHEIEVLRQLDHPHIVHLREAFWEERRLVLVMELCDGDVLSSLAGRVKEAEAAKIASQLSRALAYLHARGIVHRDLKLDNVVVRRDTGDEESPLSVKLIDFGLSRQFRIEGPGGETKAVSVKAAGTLSTAAPEVVAGGPYSSAADVWSLGAVVYKLMCGRDPFIVDGIEPDQSLIKRLEAAKIPWQPAELWRTNTSQSGREFVYNCMRAKAHSRWPADEAFTFCQTVWLSTFKAIQERPQHALSTLYLPLKRYASYSDLKRAALIVAAHCVDHRRIVALRNIFDKIDADSSGVVSAAELRAALGNCATKAELDQLFARLDYDSSGFIAFHEFLAATIEDDIQLLDDEALKDAFDRIDVDDTGTISPGNLKAILGRAASDNLVKRMIADGDIKHNGSIDYDDFCALIKPKIKIDSMHGSNSELSLSQAGIGQVDRDKGISPPELTRTPTV